MKPRLIHKPDELNALLRANAPADQIGPYFDAAEWLGNMNNLAVAIDNDMALFEHLHGSEYTGHVWFASRGKQALINGRELVAFMFDRLGASRLHGEVPAWRKDVLAYVRRLGFIPYGTAPRMAADGKMKSHVLCLLTGT